LDAITALPLADGDPLLQKPLILSICTGIKKHGYMKPNTAVGIEKLWILEVSSWQIHGQLGIAVLVKNSLGNMIQKFL
jgi:hypothetical protein